MTTEAATANTPSALPSFCDDGLMLRLAREIAMDIVPLDTVLKTLKISEFEFAVLQQNSRFQALLASACEAWNSATNTAERVRVKSLAFVEETLPEFYARVHDPKENLTAKVEVLKAVSKLAGLADREHGGGSGDHFSVTINLGGGKSMTIKKDVTPVGNSAPMAPVGALPAPAKGPVIDVQAINSELA